MATTTQAITAVAANDVLVRPSRSLWSNALWKLRHDRLTLGAMFTHHVRRGWALLRNRVSGAVVIAALGALIVTGYALYYLVNDASRATISVAHWLVGVAFAPLFVADVVIGRRASERRARHGARGVKKRVAAHSSAR